MMSFLIAKTKNMKITYILSPIILLVSSCSSNSSKRPETAESFVTHIMNDGTKKFNYTITHQVSKNNKKRQNKGGKLGNRAGGRSGRVGGQGRGSDFGGSRERINPSEQRYQLKQGFLKRLEKMLFEKQYCNEGYSELDSFYDRQMSQYKGQCQEKASEEDLVNFPNQ